MAQITISTDDGEVVETLHIDGDNTSPDYWDLSRWAPRSLLSAEVLTHLVNALAREEPARYRRPFDLDEERE